MVGRRKLSEHPNHANPTLSADCRATAPTSSRCNGSLRQLALADVRNLTEAKSERPESKSRQGALRRDRSIRLAAEQETSNAEHHFIDRCHDDRRHLVSRVHYPAVRRLFEPGSRS